MHVLLYFNNAVMTLSTQLLLNTQWVGQLQTSALLENPIRWTFKRRAY